MADDDFEVHTVEATGDKTFPMQCSALRKNGMVVMNGNRPCKIVEMSTSKTGKHGHAKVHLVAVDIFTGKKYEDLCPSTHNMYVPVVNRVEAQLIDIDEDHLSLLVGDKTKDDVRVPEGELGEKLRADFEADKNILVTIVSAMGEEAVVSYKEVSN